MTRHNISIALIWSIWLSVIFFTLRANNAPDYQMPYSAKKLLSSLLPQGWGFFTRDPKEGITEAYSYDQSTDEVSLITVKNASAANAIGFSRNARFAGIDLVFLLEYAKADMWHKGKGDFKDNIPLTADTIIADKPIQYFPEGEYILHRYEPIPFAWAGKGQESYRPYLIARVQVTSKKQ
ncbi:hypothetical protein C900_01477 [Fulvivirga imtechensis AK7]|uniref:Uncharacterized protein n=2 Tax=Fulvivirga TaxID=396811 RepID=L8JZ64_9BACT|nr:hypothetical protein C900_01477 [Fulvivirga imtechensis AK7]